MRERIGTGHCDLNSSVRESEWGGGEKAEMKAVSLVNASCTVVLCQVGTGQLFILYTVVVARFKAPGVCRLLFPEKS